MFFRQLIQDHFILGLMLLVFLGLFVAVLGLYFILFIQAIFGFFEGWLLVMGVW